MSRILKWVLPAALIGWALLFHYRQRDSYQCADCLIKQHVYQWRIGSWGGGGFSVPLTPKRKAIEESETSKIYINSRHVHDWDYAQGSPYYFFGTTWGGCGIGAGGRRNHFASFFEDIRPFRTFLKQKEESGALSPEVTLELLTLPRNPSEDPIDREFFELRSTLAGALIDEYFSQE